MKTYIFIFSILISSLCLTGCSTLGVVSFATMAATGKGFSDHALSLVTGQDCNFFNIVQGEKVCLYENSTEMMLLANYQPLDDSLKVDYLEDDADKISRSNAYLVIGSFSEQVRAESYQLKFSQWDSLIVASDKKYRVIVGPVDQQDRESMKRTMLNGGIESPWLISL